MPTTDLVTGAFGYSGTYLSRQLLAAGRRVRTLTTHPGTESAPIEVHPLRFDDPAALVRAFSGVDTFYNTYWVRYRQGGTSYQQAVEHTRVMLAAASTAGVRRVVHLSITKPSHDCFYPYYRGKAAVEDLVRASGLEHVIVRPTVIFGREDILVNNIAWLARRFPVFAIPGDGRYRVRPVHVEDLAELCVRLAREAPPGTVLDAVGPEVFSFEDLVTTVADGVGARCRLVHLPPAAVDVLLRGLAVLTRDVVLTRDEIDGLMAELVMVDGPATCPTRLTDYLREHRDEVGARYHSELARRR